MKPLKQVERTRQQYHADPRRRTVHRSSLMVPHVDGCEPVVSFLNHFLLKRNYGNVACKISAIDAGGGLIDSVTESITEARVYNIGLADRFGGDARNYLVEFFSADNLFIPYPAVMINHRNPAFCNVVHSYNRVLNDVFEDDEINGRVVDEASIDVVNSREAETFFAFSSGIAAVDAEVRVEIRAGDAIHERMLPVRLARFSNKVVGLSEIFPELPFLRGGVIRVRQPRQTLFFGRMLAGVRLKSDSAFAANHSFYDSSGVREYWSTDASSRTYPYFAGFRNVIRMYPIMSPGELSLAVEFAGTDGVVRVVEAGKLASPSGAFVEIDVGSLLERCGASQPASYRLLARSGSGGVPTRITHQLVVGDLQRRSPLEASLAVGLGNDEAFIPANRTSYTWGQMVVGRNYASRIGFVWDAPAGEPDEMEIELYSSSGRIMQFKRRLEPRGAIVLTQDDLPAGIRESETEFVWFVAKAKRADLNAFSVHQNTVSGHCSGEHGF